MLAKASRNNADDAPGAAQSAVEEVEEDGAAESSNDSAKKKGSGRASDAEGQAEEESKAVEGEIDSDMSEMDVLNNQDNVI